MKNLLLAITLVWVTLCVALAAGVAQAATINLVGTPTNPQHAASSYIAFNGAATDLNGMNLDYVTMGLSRSGVVIGTVNGTCQNNITINHTYFHLIKPTTGSALPVGFSVVCGDNILIENSSATGFTMVPVAGSYLNGDGDSSEYKGTHVTIRNFISTNNGDGCFDNKASILLLDTDTAIGCHYGYRLWGKGVTVTNSICDLITEACVQLAGATGVTVDGQVIKVSDPKSKVPVVDIRIGAQAAFTNCKVEDEGGNLITAGLGLTWASYQSGATKTNANVTFDASCSNTPPPPPVVVVPPVVVPPVANAVTWFYPAKAALVNGSCVKAPSTCDHIIHVTTAAILKAMKASGPISVLDNPIPWTVNGVTGWLYTQAPAVTAAETKAAA